MRKSKIKPSLIILFLLVVGFSAFMKIIEDYKFKTQELKSLENSIQRKKNGIKIIERDLIKINQEIEACD